MPSIAIQKNPKKPRGKMYECTAFFPDTFPKKWKYVRDLQSFAQFLNSKHPSWKYINVYEKGSKQFLKRFYPQNPIPKVLPFLVLASMGLLTQKFTSGNTSSVSQAIHYPLKNTFGTFTSTASSEATSNNDFNYCATIPTITPQKGGSVC